MDELYAELAERTGNGLNVRIVWERATKQVLLFIDDLHSDTNLMAVVPNDKALDALAHPFAYVE